MKKLLNLFSLIIFFSCCKKNKIVNNDYKVSNNVQKNKIINNNSFKLNSENVMEFFLEYEKKLKKNKVRLLTDFGNIDILLFEETKFHRANFIYLTENNYFDNTQFYRVINDFMIQGGNSDSKLVANKRNEIGKYLLPNDFDRGYKHGRGMVSMPSSSIDNPHKMASPYEFFIVQSKKGAFHLDQDYTIFGKVIKGMNVVDKIASVNTDDYDWPIKNVYINKAEIID